MPSEWRDEPDPFRSWCKARLKFAAENPGTVLGDPLDCLAEHRRLKRQAAS